MILITTDLAMPAVDIIRLYGVRFKIELSFKRALRVLGVYAYHFRMRAMPKIARPAGTQHLHRKSDPYRDAVRRKLCAYHRHIQIGLITQGILQYLAVSCPRLVWVAFGSYDAGNYEALRDKPESGTLKHIGSNVFVGARGRIRTGKTLRSRDFKSLVSTSSTTRAMG